MNNRNGPLVSKIRDSRESQSSIDYLLSKAAIPIQSCCLLLGDGLDKITPWLESWQTKIDNLEPKIDEIRRYILKNFRNQK